MSQLKLISGEGIAGQAYQTVKGILAGVVDPVEAILDSSGIGDLHVRCVNGDTFILAVDGKAYKQGQPGSLATFTGSHLATLRNCLIQSDPFTAPK